jgi:hypothetical protein
VKDTSDSGTRVWYAGRLVFPSPDSDLTVDSSRGLVTVTVSQEFVQQATPAYVRVRVDRQPTPRVSIIENVSEVPNVISISMRPIPGWEWAGLFTWERRQILRTVTYAPVVAGRGGAGVNVGTSAVKVYWYLGGIQPGSESGVASVLVEGETAHVDVTFSIDPVTRVLTLSNIPGSRAYTVSVQASASDAATWRDPIKANTSFSCDGVTEGWGADYKRFMDAWYHITHPVPKPRIGPPGPVDYRGAIDQLIYVYNALREVNATVAENLQPLVLDQVHRLHRMTRGQ